MIIDCSYLTLILFPAFIRLKYIGQEDSSKELWADPSSIEIRPVGYCLEHKLLLEPPHDLVRNLDSQKVIESVIKEHRVIDCDVSLLSPVQQMKPGLKLELEDVNESRTVWIVTVKCNVGGRLLVRYALPSSVSTSTEDAEVWIFCLSPRLHSVGWASKHPMWTYMPPKKLRSLCNEEWSDLALRIQNETSSHAPLTFQRELATHSFVVGTRVSVLALSEPTNLRAATVVDVVDNHRFTVLFDPPFQEGTLCCFAGDGCVLPLDEVVDGKIEQPEIDPTEGARPSDLGFECATALEVVNPWKSNDICVGTITAFHGNLLKIHLEVLQEDTTPLPDILLPCTSFELFPVGWCESHGYLLRGPPKVPASEPAEQLQSEVVATFAADAETEIPAAGVSYWCPKIYFNFRCFSGPLLSKLRIAALPRSVGPGPILLVLKEVLSLLINGAYKPGSVLKQLQGEPGAPLPKGTQLEPLKAKYKQTTYRGSIPIASTAADVSDYCKWVCEKLQCCTCLFGPDLVGDPCPRRCTATMVKVHWQHKKRAAKFNGRNKKLVDALKNLPSDSASLSIPEENVANNSTTKSGPADSVMENSDDSNEPNESNSAMDASSGGNVNASSAGGADRGKSEESGDTPVKKRRISSDVAAGQCRKHELDRMEESAKKKRGRPRKNSKTPLDLADTSTDIVMCQDKVDQVEWYSSLLPQPPPFIPFTSQVSGWTVEQVVTFLTQCGIAKGYLDKFFEEANIKLHNLNNFKL